MNKKLLFTNRGIRKMQTAAGGPLLYEDEETIPNDNVWVDVLGRQKNPQLEERGIQGAKSHRAWEELNPIAAQWGNVIGATPFLIPAAAASATVLPELVVGAKALNTAAKATRVARKTAPLFKRLFASRPMRNLARVPYKAIGKFGNRILNGLFFGHGIKRSVKEGGVSPVTALELATGVGLAKDANNVYKEVKGLRKLFKTRKARQAASEAGITLAPPPEEITVNLNGLNSNGAQAVRQAATQTAATPSAATVVSPAAISPEAQKLQQFLTHYDTGDFSDIQYYDDLAKAIIDGRLPNLAHELTNTPYNTLPLYEQHIYDRLERVLKSDTWKLNKLQKELKIAIDEGRSEQEINAIRNNIRDIEQKSQNLGEVPIIDRQGTDISYGGNTMHYFPEGSTDNINIDGAYFFNPYGRPDVFLSKVWDQLKTGDKISIANGFGHLSINSLPLYLSSLTRRLNQAMIDPVKEKGFLLEALSDRFVTNSSGKIPYRRYLIPPDYSNPNFGPEMAAKLQKAQQDLYNAYDQFNYFKKVGALGKTYRNSLWETALNIEKLPAEAQVKAWEGFFAQHPEIEAEVQNKILNHGLIERLPEVQVTPEDIGAGTIFEYPGFTVTHLLFGGKLSKKEFVKKMNKILKKGGLLKRGRKAFVNGVSILDSNPDAYKYVKKKIAKAQEGTNTVNWKGFGKTVLEQLPSIVNSVNAQQAARQQVKTNEIADEVAEAEDFQNNLKKYYGNYKTYSNYLKQQAAQNGLTINFSDIDTDYYAHQLAWNDTQANSQARKAKTQLKNSKILQEGNKQLTNAIMGGIGKIGQAGYNLYASYKANKNNTNNSSTIDNNISNQNPMMAKDPNSGMA